MQTLEIPIFIAISFSLLFAYWCQMAIPRFARYINRQVYDEYHHLSGMPCSDSYADFLRYSKLQPQQSQWAMGFYVLFPLLAFGFVEQPLLALLLMILAFLALLDSCYYLTDIRYVFVIFVLVILQQMQNFYLESSLAPLFTTNQLLIMLLSASLLGLFYYFMCEYLSGKKRLKLPFIPFISVSTLCVIIDKIYFSMF
ncbi:hypothetical protein RZ65_04180 [[Haemophilus] ducreyi]|uniref:prepilin peptidase n=1 Tax=Haemophilus ducreyi TaxID=730 RepID=UPI0006554208|nr:prepilin peptidase [[Haemophilus] ducreyi]AKO42670.1 hypothetical protein RZ65_04180 [[Haemophilus] ducreyi]